MSTEETKTKSSPSSDAKPESISTPSTAGTSASPDVDAGVAWPPPEAAPSGAAADAAQPTADPASEKPAKPDDSGVMTAPEASPAKAGDVKATAEAEEMPAATPQEEMGLSNSTLHWLEDGEQAVPGHLAEPGTMPSYDPRAPVPGRKRAVLVTGGAAAVALIVAGSFYVQAQKKHAGETPAAVAVEPARDLTTRAETALAANRVDEAMELAHLALVADARFADAHFLVGTIKKARNQGAEARIEFRKYLELAPLGTHAEAARKALESLPP